jgi:tRNA-splicing ligase RtcB
VDERFAYRSKYVHDISVEDSTVRLWSARGRTDRRLIEKAFAPLLRTPFVYPYVALMPDYHPGEGSMIGSVIPTRGVLLPSVIGGDLGCGMAAVRLPLNRDEIEPKLRALQKKLLERIPVGTAHNARVSERVKSNAIWRRESRAPFLTQRLHRKLLRQFASLGGGNHFLEIQADQEEGVWVMLHSGSRYLGVIVRDTYVESGREHPGVDADLYRRLPHLVVGSPLASDYLHDLVLALDFARESRKEMMLRALEVLADEFTNVERVGAEKLIESAFDVAHNLVLGEEHFGELLFVHRKGATRVAEGEIGMIPGSMGTMSYVVEGRGNRHSFCSCSHGAGRAMSRAEAFKRVSDREFRRSMKGVVYEHDERIRDESPLAYKDVESVLRAQKDVVKILFQLRPLLSIKGM